ncbi:hypothetical protein CHELA40_50588 [Chelatococcus asaccharovorans]|nr:hypothetical protein CHELA17_20557 [Chelatococcus asaccharovorans]CAH1693482.1 hypothetical protein CHELA40_50588 [Chelatococcus asaccharovorans]
MVQAVRAPAFAARDRTSILMILSYGLFEYKQGELKQNKIHRSRSDAQMS